jgi:hypothetical protein
MVPLPVSGHATAGAETREDLHSHCNQQRVHSGAERGGIGQIPGRHAPHADDVAPQVDPLALSLACAGGGPATAPEPYASHFGVTPTGAAIDVALAAEVLQRVAWGGDRRRGVARLELGGDYAGTIVVVRGEGREVALELTLPAGRSAGELPERLAARLAARGLVVRELVVR